MADLIQRNLYVIAFVDLAFIVFLCWFLVKKYRLLYEFLLWIQKYLFHQILSQINLKLGLTILIGASLILYFSFSFPIGIDESYTLIHFSKKGFFSSLFTYPVPNNHVLLSLISNCFYPIFSLFDNPRTFRVLIVFITIFYITVIAGYFKKYYSFERSIIFVILFFSIPAFLDYSYQIRGYCLFITIGGLISIISYSHINHKFFFFLFFILNFIGFATSPSWLYSFIPMTLILFLSKIRNIKFLKKLLLYTTALILSCLLFYSPIIFFYGADSLINNPYVVPIENYNFITALSNIKEIYFYWSNYHNIICLISSVAIILCMTKSKNYSFFVFPVSIIILMMLLKQNPVPRITVGSLSFILIFCMLSFQRITLHKFFFPISIFIFIVGSAFLSQFMKNDYFTLDTKLRNSQNFIYDFAKTNKLKVIYISNKDLILNNLICELQWKKPSVEIKLFSSEYEAYKNFKEDISTRSKILINSNDYSQWSSVNEENLSIDYSKTIGPYNFAISD